MPCNELFQVLGQFGSVARVKSFYARKGSYRSQAPKRDKHSDRTHGRSSVSGSGQKGRGTLARDRSNTTCSTLTVARVAVPYRLTMRSFWQRISGYERTPLRPRDCANVEASMCTIHPRHRRHHTAKHHTCDSFALALTSYDSPVFSQHNFLVHFLPFYSSGARSTLPAVVRRMPTPDSVQQHSEQQHWP